MDDLGTKELYRNFLNKDWNALKKDLLSLIENNVDELMILLLQPLSVHGDSIIHFLVHSGTKEPLKQILGLDTLKNELVLLHCFTRWVNTHGNTVLHEAAIIGNLEAVKLLVENDEEPSVMENDSNETPLFIAAAFGNTKIVEFLASCAGQTVISDDGTKQLKENHRTNKNGDTILFAAVQGQHFGTALELLKIDEKLTELEYGNQTSFNMLAQIPSAFIETSIWKKLLFFCLPVGCDHNDDSDEIESKYKDIESCLHRKGSNLDGEENKDQDIESGLHRKVGSDRNREMEESDIKCCLIRLCHTFLAVLYYIYLSIWTHIIRVFPLAKKIWKEKRDHGFARELARKLMKKDRYSCEQNLKRHLYNPEIVEEPTGNLLFDAIRSRNVEVVTLALDKYPQQLEELNQKILNLATEEEEREQGNTLFAAMRTGNVELVKLTLETYPQQLDLLNFRMKKILLRIKPFPLFAAIRAGNVKVVKLILKEYPQALEQINSKKQNILHVAAMYRQKEIFNLVKTKEIPMIRLARQIDDDGCTILHSVADTQHYKGGTRSGPAYKLQEELKWFDSVKEIMPSTYIMLRDKNNQTALEKFKKEHDDQLKKAQSWIKETSQSCSGVAILVVSVVLAAAFAVPGGTNNNDGFQILLQGVAVSCSFSCIVIFLSILTSSFELEDFRASLPRQLTFGFMLLSISVVATLSTFTSTIALVLRSDNSRKPTFGFMLLSSSAAICPVIMVALTHFSLIFSHIKEWVSSVTPKFPRCPRFFGNQYIKI